MWFALVPERDRGNVILQGQVATTAAPAQSLNSYTQILLKTNGVHNVPAIHTEALLTTIESIGFNHLRQTQKRRGVDAVFPSGMFEVPRTTEIIFCSCTANCGKILVAVQVEFDLALAPPASIIRLPCKIGTNVLSFAPYTIQQRMHLFITSRIATAPLDMKISNICRNVRQRIIDLVVEHNIFKAEIFNGHTSTLTKRHLPVGVHSTSRVDCDWKGVDIATLTPAIRKKIAERTFY